jgi:hypothetical protein
MDIKINLEIIVSEDVEWLKLAEGRIQGQTVVNILLKRWIS